MWRGHGLMGSADLLISGNISPCSGHMSLCSRPISSSAASMGPWARHMGSGARQISSSEEACRHVPAICPHGLGRSAPLRRYEATRLPHGLMLSADLLIGGDMAPCSRYMASSGQRIRSSAEPMTACCGSQGLLVGGTDDIERLGPNRAAPRQRCYVQLHRL